MWRMMMWGCISVLAMASSAWAAPKIFSADPVYDFGKLDNRQVVHRTFVLTNAGDEDLHIGQVQTSCGCTAADLDKKTLAPGESVDLKVHLSLKGVKGNQHKQITVHSNDPLEPRLILKLKGEATSPITVTPSQLLFGEVSPAGAATAPVADANGPNEPVAAKSLIRHVMVAIEDSLPLQVTRTRVISGRNRERSASDTQWAAALEDDGQGSGIYRLRVEMTPGTILGQASAIVRLHTDNADFPHIDVPVSAVIAGEVNVSPRSIVLMERNASPVTRYILVTRGPGSDENVDFQITKVTPPLPEIAVEVRPVGRRGYRIKLADMLPTPDMADTKVVIETNLDSMKRIEIPVRVVADQNQTAAK